MSANSTFSLLNLDFDANKQNFINYLKGNTVFKDASFTGSNMNVLLDILSVDTFQNAFLTNMVFAEMFMDSAQKRDSIVSHAKELNYLPVSNKSAFANVSFTITTSGISSPLTIPKGCFFSGINSNGSFSFTTAQAYNLNSSNSIFYANNIQIFQGTYVNDVFVVDLASYNQQFILSNPNIDTDSLTVTVTENGANTTFTQYTTLYNLAPNTNAFFLQAAQNNQYEILFGDNLFGRYPINGALVTANYRVTGGTDGNGINQFNIYYSLGAFNGGTATVGPITVISGSQSGANAQSADSIRFYAPRYYAAQNRAVVPDDYSSLIISKFAGQISDVNVYGGETLNPKQYGTTVICVKPTIGTIVPNFIKNRITNFLSNTVVIPITTTITDPDYFYTSIKTTVTYDTTQTSLSASDLETQVLNSMTTYFVNNVEGFERDFRYSKFCTAIDNTSDAVVSNDTKVLAIKRLNPVPYNSTSYIINYNNPAYNSGSAKNPCITSTLFTYVNNNLLYPNSVLQDDSNGNIQVISTQNGITTTVNIIGTIDYTTGTVTINNLYIDSYIGSYISLYMSLLDTDILVKQSQILLIDPNDVSINAVAK